MASVTLPWCPPAKYGYDGIPSHNKIMLLHYQSEVEREEQLKDTRKRVIEEENNTST
jgi:hypothetical protein